MYISRIKNYADIEYMFNIVLNLTILNIWLLSIAEYLLMHSNFNT